MQIKLEEAKFLLLKGKVVAIPTETVYGLAASLLHERAIDQIFVLKGRPSGNPLSILVSSQDQVQEIVSELPEEAKLLIETFWPGPLTLVLPVNEDKVPERVRAGLSTVGIRMPDQNETLSLIGAVGPVVAPSANLSGRPSSTCVDHVEQDFGKEFPVVNGGECSLGVESTIIRWSEKGWELLRLGKITGKELERVLGSAVVQAKSPARDLPHYRPKCRIVSGKNCKNGAVVLGYSGRGYPNAKKVIVFGSLDRPAELLRDLYRVLRKLDEEGEDEVWVDLDLPTGEVFSLFRDRLYRL